MTRPLQVTSESRCKSGEGPSTFLSTVSRSFVFRARGRTRGEDDGGEGNSGIPFYEVPGGCVDLCVVSYLWSAPVTSVLGGLSPRV